MISVTALYFFDISHCFFSLSSLPTAFSLTTFDYLNLRASISYYSLIRRSLTQTLSSTRPLTPYFLLLLFYCANSSVLTTELFIFIFFIQPYSGILKGRHRVNNTARQVLYHQFSFTAAFRALLYKSFNNIRALYCSK